MSLHLQTLLDVSNESEINSLGEIELSPDEDSCTSLAVGPRKDTRSTLVFGGVNGSLEEAQKGRNPHFRVFTVTQPGKSAKSGGVKIAEIARDSLFASNDTDTYQRVIQLSQPFDGAPQLGAISTGLSKDSHQIVLFDVPATGATRFKSRGRLEIDQEAMDIDVIQTGPDKYQLAYINKYDLFTVDVSKSGISEAKCVFTLTSDDGPLHRPAFRSIRYLSPGFLFAVVNKPNRTGVVLHGYRLPTKGQEFARLAEAKELPGSVTQSTGLAIRNLTPPTSPAEKQGESQYVIAVAGNDSSITLFTLEYKQSANVDLLSNLAPFQTIKSAHPAGITGLSFSAFNPPKSSKSSSELTIKLASVSMANTAVVHSIPLKKFVNKSAPARKAGPPKPARYVVALQSKRESPATVITLLTVTVLLIALIGQVFLEAIGHSRPILGTNRVLPASWTIPMRQGPVLGSKAFGDLLTGLQPEQHEQIYLRHSEAGELGQDGLPELEALIHDQEVHGPAKSWGEMDTKEQQLWKQRLKKTGQWAEGMGETVFKGILFSEIGGAIGAMVGGAL
jgi:hypothetical protein